MIRSCDKHDLDQIRTIINEGASVYKGVIPDDRWKEPYMALEELQHEWQAGVAFWGYEESDALLGVMGLQKLSEVTLIRHAYVRTGHQNQGIGAQLLSHLLRLAQGPVLVGTWADALWAIRFYRKHGFDLVSAEEKTYLLTKYWNIPERQIETSVVLRKSDAKDADPPSASIPYSIP